MLPTGDVTVTKLIPTAKECRMVGQSGVTIPNPGTPLRQEYGSGPRTVP